MLIRDYDTTDVEVVWRVVEEDLIPLKQAVTAMQKQVESAEE